MGNIENICKKFNNLRVLVIGDVMLDSYVFGKVERVSPEAPVPVIDEERREDRLGGAANVVLNVKALGAQPILCSVIGEDDQGKVLLDLMMKEGLTTDGLISSPKRRTTVKQRVIGNNHLLLRIDTENKHDLDSWEDDQLTYKFKELLKGVDVVIFQDYNKGVLHQSNINNLISLCKEANIPTTVDPKKVNFLNYKGVDLFKPNLKELKEGLNKDSNLKEISNLAEAEKELRKILGNKFSMVTLSELGVFIADSTGHSVIPAHIRNISDVSGAGDSVISVAAMCLALDLPKEQIASLSNLAGGLVCEESGVVPVSLEKFIAEAKRAL